MPVYAIEGEAPRHEDIRYPGTKENRPLETQGEEAQRKDQNQDGTGPRKEKEHSKKVPTSEPRNRLV